MKIISTTTLNENLEYGVIMDTTLNEEIKEDNTEYVDYTTVLEQLIYFREISRKLTYAIDPFNIAVGEVKLQKN